MNIFNLLKSAADRKRATENEYDYVCADELEDAGESVQVYWNDLTETAQQRILDLLGGNGNYDMIPIVEIWKGAD